MILKAAFKNGCNVVIRTSSFPVCSKLNFKVMKMKIIMEGSKKFSSGIIAWIVKNKLIINKC